MPLVHHIALNCRDRLKSEAFYARHFGFQRVRVFSAGQPDEFVMMRLGAVCLELFGSAAGSEQTGGEQAIGFKHLAFEVPQLEPAIERLRAEGVHVDDIIELPHLAPGFRICFFKDPDGNILELMEGWQDAA